MGALPLAVGTHLNGSQAPAMLHALAAAGVRATVVFLAATADGAAEGDDVAALAARVAFVWAADAAHMGGRITVYSRHRPRAARVVALARGAGLARPGCAGYLLLRRARHR